MAAFPGMMRPSSCVSWPGPPHKNKGKEEEMAEAALSSAEEALENQRLGPLQFRVAALCAEPERRGLRRQLTLP